MACRQLLIDILPGLKAGDSYGAHCDIESQ